MPCAIEQVQLAAPKSQSAQDPAVGPVDDPVAQVLSDSHQPHPLVAVQPPHAVCPAQGSGPTHSERSHDQLVQLPVSGPIESPSEHAPVSPHHPQGKSAVHASQSVAAAQVLPPHSEPSQLQSPQEPAVGPALVPPWQLPPPAPHHPQPLRPVQSPQSVADAQVSAPPPHWLESHDQSPQLPVSGPVELPVVQPVPSHHPQG